MLLIIETSREPPDIFEINTIASLEYVIQVIKQCPSDGQFPHIQISIKLLSMFTQHTFIPNKNVYFYLSFINNNQNIQIYI